MVASKNASVFSNKGFWWMVRWCIVLAVLAVVMDWVFVFVVWKPDGMAKLGFILERELAHTTDLGGVAGDATAFAVLIANNLYALVFKLTGLHDVGYRFADSAPLNAPDTTARNLYIMAYDWIKVAMLGVQLLGVRVAILIQSLPVFLLAGIVAFTDGWWAGRYIRREAAGRESSFIYHRAKHYIFVSFTAVWGLYLLLPYSIDPRLVIFPFVLAMALSIRYWAAYFKKYL